MRFSCIAIAIAGLGGAANAQDSDSTAVPRHTLEVWTAVARDQPLKTRNGRLHDRDLYVIGGRARWPLARWTNVEVAYTTDVLPAIISTGMPAYSDSLLTCPPNEPCVLPIIPNRVMTRHTTYGAGAAPLGLELRLRAAPPLSFLVRGSAGVVYFSRPVPDPAEKRLNFMLDAGVGAEVRLTPRVGIVVGYSLNHISNAGRGPVNPAMDSRMVELGLTFAR
ncbi:MAG TPA: acyloxyacyl hydrolase [Gemmatimonadaceae bacterium]|nr:acyloxyacyl hydrolase [Gemmatimonadaceae bacterium]